MASPAKGGGRRGLIAAGRYQERPLRAHRRDVLRDDLHQPDRCDPLTRRAKALMAAESTLSAVTVLLIAARAVKILA